MKYARIYEGGELAKYECEKGTIEIHDFDVTPSGRFHRDYVVNGIRFSSLREAKAYMEKED